MPPHPRAEWAVMLFLVNPTSWMNLPEPENVDAIVDFWKVIGLEELIYLCKEK